MSINYVVSETSEVMNYLRTGGHGPQIQNDYTPNVFICKIYTFTNDGRYNVPPVFDASHNHSPHYITARLLSMRRHIRTLQVPLWDKQESYGSFFTVQRIVITA